jgi:hypothetical protein
VKTNLNVMKVTVCWWRIINGPRKLEKMKLYFDESGDFNPPINGGPKFSFVVGVIVPESATEKLKEDFDWFVGQLAPSEFVRGEPKGCALTIEHRRVLMEILKSHESVMLVPISVNVGVHDPIFLASLPAKIRALIESNLRTPSTLMTVKQRKELAARFGRLNAQVLLRLFSYAIAVLKGVEAIACRYHCRRFHSQYEPVTITFDRAARPGSREELVLLDALPGWIANWSRTIPLRIPSEMNESHPFLAAYGKREAERWTLHLGKMLSGRIAFENSRVAWPLQLADFVANTWAQTISDYEGTRGLRSLFPDLYRKSALPDETPLGVVAPTDRTDVTLAPAHLEVFARIVFREPKILPCC